MPDSCLTMTCGDATHPIRYTPIITLRGGLESYGNNRADWACKTCVDVYTTHVFSALGRWDCLAAPIDLSLLLQSHLYVNPSFR